jgi:hypothetical protein
MMSIKTMLKWSITHIYNVHRKLIWKEHILYITAMWSWIELQLHNFKHNFCPNIIKVYLWYSLLEDIFVSLFEASSYFFKRERIRRKSTPPMLIKGKTYERWEGWCAKLMRGGRDDLQRHGGVGFYLICFIKTHYSFMLICWWTLDPSLYQSLKES